jgi:hypothetical protein
MSTFNDKLRISFGSGMLFALMNIPQVLSFFENSLFNSDTNCLTNNGIIIQVLIFAIITFLTMGKSKLSTLTKVGHTTYGALIFFFVSNPVTYKLVSSVLGNWVSNQYGCPTLPGSILHTLVYIAILTSVMYFP